MPNGRDDFYLIAMPDGRVLAVGGQAEVGPDRYNPYATIAGDAWKTMAPMPIPRPYHASALLLPDGSIYMAGGCPGTCTPPALGTYQIFKPPYFFGVTRPTITSGPDSTRYNKVARFYTPDAANVKKVRLIRPGSATHSFDHDQRSLELSFSVDNNSPTPALKIKAPAHGYEAPPGWYMLFIATGDDTGNVPSVAHWVHVSSNLGSLP